MLSIAQQLISRRSPEEEERLLRLFWNRAELKREFAKLQRERDRMFDQIRQQEGVTLRTQQRLEQIEGLLADPERAANAAVFYQLRGVWQHARRRLARLSRDLAARQQEQEVQREAARFEEHRQAALVAIENRLAPFLDRRLALEGQLAGVEAELKGLTGFWNFFARRRAEAERVVHQSSLASVHAQIERYEKARRDKLEETSPAPEGLGVEGRRIVNLSLLALSQELVLHFTTHNVASLARDASLRQVSDVSYGGLPVCRNLSQQIQGVLRSLDRVDDLPARVRRRAAYLRLQAVYRRDNDTVPVAEVLEDIPLALTADDEPHAGNGGSLPVNVLTDEYWDIYGALMK
jgi:hypothetical protein